MENRKTLERSLKAVGIALAIVVACTSTAHAACGAQGRPSYSDISSVYLRDGNAEKPQTEFLINAEGELYLRSFGSSPLKGTFEGKDGAPLFAKLISLLERSAYYDMQLAPYPVPTRGWRTIAIATDFPEYHIAVLRCGVLTTLETYGGRGSLFLAYYGAPETKKFIELFQQLAEPVYSWPWAREPRIVRPPARH